MRLWAPKCEPMKMNGSLCFLRAKIVGIPQNHSPTGSSHWGFAHRLSSRVYEILPIGRFVNARKNLPFQLGGPQFTDAQKKNVIMLQTYTAYIRIQPHFPLTFVIQLTSQQLPIWYCSSHWSPINCLGKKTSNLHPSLHPLSKSSTLPAASEGPSSKHLLVHRP